MVSRRQCFRLRRWARTWTGWLSKVSKNLDIPTSGEGRKTKPCLSRRWGAFLSLWESGEKRVDKLEVYSNTTLTSYISSFPQVPLWDLQHIFQAGQEEGSQSGWGEEKWAGIESNQFAGQKRTVTEKKRHSISCSDFLRPGFLPRLGNSQHQEGGCSWRGPWKERCKELVWKSAGCSEYNPWFYLSMFRAIM